MARMTEAARREEAEAAWRLYHPPVNGVHVCGASQDDAAMTVALWPCRTPAEARALFEALRPEHEKADDEPTELVVDLCVGDEIVEDFSITRQMLARLSATAERLRIAETVA